MIVGPDYSNTADWIAGIAFFLAIFILVGMVVSAWRRRP